MKRWVAFFLFLCGVCSGGEHVVTYEFSGGRFGDQLLSYLHAKWIAHKYGMTVLYKPFQYSNELVLSEKEMQFSYSYFRSHRRVQLGQGEIGGAPEPMLYVCPYFPEDRDELMRGPYGPYLFHMSVDWKDEGFRKVVFEMVASKRELQLTRPMKDRVNVAIHVREGGGYDPDSFRTELPLKLPPLSFYFEGFPKVLELFRDQAIYCHVFTDSQKPEELVKTFQGLVPSGMDVVFGWRKIMNRHNMNVLNDFFSLFGFDVLIRSQSNFSLIPSLLHDFAVVYCPTAYSIEDKRVKIEKVDLIVDEKLYRELRKR